MALLEQAEMEAQNQVDAYKSSLGSGGGGSDAYKQSLADTSVKYADTTQPMMQTAVYNPTPADYSEGSYYQTGMAAPDAAINPDSMDDTITPPPGPGDVNDQPPSTTDMPADGTTPGADGSRPSGPSTVQELYPEAPEGQEFEEITVADPTGASVTEADMGVTEIGVTEAESGAGDVIEGAVGEVTDLAGEAQQTDLTAEQQVDAELARILGQDSPLLQQARAEAARMANARGLMNSSMAAGMTYGEMVKAAMPMAQQNAQQAFEREMENTRLRQESGQFTAEQLTQLRALEAELGQELSIFNADQLNEAERIAAELRTAIEQGNQQAYNEAALQLAELQRDAQAQQAEIDYASAEREFLETQAYNEQIIDAVTTLNEQYMIGEQQIDIENVRGTYQQIISTNETAATMFDGYMSAIGSILDNPDMSSAQAAEAIRYLVDGLEGSLRMISEINGLDFGDLAGAIPGSDTGGGGGPTCFKAGTCFRMADGTVKKIEDIKAKDEMAVGGRVKFAISGDGTQEEWFDANGITVSGSHAIKKDGVWMRVRDAGFEQVDTIDTFYTVINEHHRMIAENGQIFTDYDEIDLEDSGWEDFVIDKLNGERAKFKPVLAA